MSKLRLPTRILLAYGLVALMARNGFAQAEVPIPGSAPEVSAEEQALVKRYNDEVAPILSKSCVDCHKPGTAEPFLAKVPIIGRVIKADKKDGLAAFQILGEARFGADGESTRVGLLNALKTSTGNGSMPPGKYKYAPQHWGSGLSAEQKVKIASWVDDAVKIWKEKTPVSADPETRARQILMDNCASCHKPENMKGKLDVTDMKALAGNPKFIKPGDPDNSELLQQVIAGEMPPKGKDGKDKLLTEEDQRAIAEWILKLIDSPPPQSGAEVSGQKKELQPAGDTAASPVLESGVPAGSANPVGQ